MTIIVIIAVVIFLWWSLAPAKSREPNLTDIINNTQRGNGEYSNVYKTKLLGRDFYYVSESPKEVADRKVFTGTKNECGDYMYQHNA